MNRIRKKEFFFSVIRSFKLESGGGDGGSSNSFGMKVRQYKKGEVGLREIASEKGISS